MAPRIVFLGSTVDANGAYQAGDPSVFGPVINDPALKAAMDNAVTGWDGIAQTDAHRINVIEDTTIDIVHHARNTAQPPTLTYFIYRSDSPPSRIEDVDTMFVVSPAVANVFGGVVHIPFSVSTQSGDTISFVDTVYPVGTATNFVFPKGYSVGFAVFQRGWQVLTQDPSYSWSLASGGDLLNYSTQQWYDQCNSNLPIAEQRSSTTSKYRAKSTLLTGSSTVFDAPVLLFGVEDWVDMDYNDLTFGVVAHTANAVAQTPSDFALVEDTSTVDPAWSMSGVQGLEDIYDEHGDDGFGDYNDCILRYYTDVRNDMPDIGTTILYRLQVVAKLSDYAHQIDLHLPYLNTFDSNEYVIHREQSSPATGRSTTVSTVDANTRVRVLDNDAEHDIPNRGAVHIHIRITFTQGIHLHRDVVASPHLVFTTINTGNVFETGVRYQNSGGYNKLQVMHIRDRPNTEFPAEGKRMLDAYPGCEDFLRHDLSTTVEDWIDSNDRDTSIMTSIGNIAFDTNVSHPRFLPNATSSDLMM